MDKNTTEPILEKLQQRVEDYNFMHNELSDWLHERRQKEIESSSSNK